MMILISLRVNSNFVNDINRLIFITEESDFLSRSGRNSQILFRRATVSEA
jgi:hypothetical protein